MSAAAFRKPEISTICVICGEEMVNISRYPTREEVQRATRFRLCAWHRFLPSPTTDAEREILALIEKRYKEMGGFTPEISKQIGWENPS